MNDLEIQPTKNRKELQHGEPLDEIEHQLTQFQQKQHYQRRNNRVIVGTCMGITTLTLIITVHRRKKLITKICERSKAKTQLNSSNNEEEMQPLPSDNTEGSQNR